MSAEHLDQLFGLHGKVALVTGASSGLGVEFAQGLAMAGADVAVVARRLERLQESPGNLRRSAYGPTLSRLTSATKRRSMRRCSRSRRPWGLSIFW